MKKISIMVTDDHKLLRDAWILFLNDDPRFIVVAEAGTGEDAVELARKFRPDVATLDINLPGISGFETIALIRKSSPGMKILGLSMHSEPAYVRSMMEKGAMGYITKNSSISEELCQAIVEIQSNRKYICSEIKDILSVQMMEGGKPGDVNTLSKREIEIIGLIKTGHSSRETAALLAITLKTVEAHRYNILKKFKLKNTAAMINHFNNNQPFC